MEELFQHFFVTFVRAVFLEIKPNTFSYREPGKGMQNIAKQAQAEPGRRVKKDH